MNKIKYVIGLLEKAYNKNCEAHNGYTECYGDKMSILIYVCAYIKKNNLPIKYGRQKDCGLNSSIIYFEYLGKQVSFHDFSKTLRKIKIFKGEWTGIINETFPFSL